MAFKKTMATKRDEHKEGPKRVRDPLNLRRTPQNKAGIHTKRDTHHTFRVTGTTPLPPSGREHPEGLPIPPYLWKTLWITLVTHVTM